MNIVNIGLANISRRFLATEQSKKRKHSHFNDCFKTDIPLKVDRVNSLIFSPVISFFNNSGGYMNKNTQYGVYQTASTGFGIDLLKPKNVFLTSSSNSKIQQKFDQTKDENIKSINKINKIHNINKINKIKKTYKKNRNLHCFNIYSEKILRPATSLNQPLILINRNQNIIGKPGTSQSKKMPLTQSFKKLERSQETQNEVNPIINFNALFPSTSKCLVDYGRQGKNISIKNLVAGQVFEERRKMLEKVEKLEFREDFFKRHVIHEIPSNIEGIKINTKEKMLKELSKLTNNIKRVHTKIRTDNSDVWELCQQMENFQTQNNKTKR